MPGFDLTLHGMFIYIAIYLTHCLLVITRTTRTPAFRDTPRCLMITHTSDSHQIPSQNKTKSKLQSLKQDKVTKFKKMTKIQILEFCKKVYTRHTFRSCLIRCIYIKWIQPKLEVLQSRHGMRDGRTDGKVLCIDVRTTWPQFCRLMMTSSNGNIFRVTGHLCGEFTSPRWIPRTKASDAELWCFLWSASE